MDDSFRDSVQVNDGRFVMSGHLYRVEHNHRSKTAARGRSERLPAGQLLEHWRSKRFLRSSTRRLLPIFQEHQRDFVSLKRESHPMWKSRIAVLDRLFLACERRFPIESMVLFPHCLVESCFLLGGSRPEEGGCLRLPFSDVPFCHHDYYRLERNRGCRACSEDTARRHYCLLLACQ